MHHAIRVMTQQEALKEFEDELKRLQEQEEFFEQQHQSGMWAMAPVYTGAYR